MDLLWMLLPYVLGAGMGIVVMRHPSELAWGALVAVMIVDFGAYSFLKDFYSDRE